MVATAWDVVRITVLAPFAMNPTAAMLLLLVKMILAGGIPYLLLRNNRPQEAAWFLASAAMVVSSIYIVLSGGMHSSAVALQMGSVAIGVLLLGNRGAVFIAATSAAFIGGLALWGARLPAPVFHEPLRAILANFATAISLVAVPAVRTVNRLKELSLHHIRDLAQLESEHEQLKQAQEQLSFERTHLRTILDSGPECIKLVSPEGKLLEMNPAGLAMIEVDSFETVRGRRLSGLVDAEFREAFDDLHARACQGARGSMEYSLTGARGSRLWLETHVAPLRRPDGGLVAAVGATRDITSRKETEAALHDSEQRFRILFANAPFCALLTDSSLNIIGCSDLTLNTLGYASEEMEGLSLLDLESGLTGPELRHIAAVANSDSFRTFESRLRRKDGSAIDVSVSSKAIRVSGRAMVYSAFQDITARKAAEAALQESEERFRTLFENAPFCAILADPDDLSIIDCNERAHTQLGYTREEFLRLRIPSFSIRHSAAQIQEMRQAVGPGGVLQVESRHRTKDGRTLDIWVTSIPIQVDGRRVRYAVFQDITARKAAEVGLQESEERFRVLFANAPFCAVLIDPSDLSFIDCNLLANSVYGYTREELLKLNLLDLDVQFNEAEIRAIGRTARPETPRVFETRHRRKDGEIVDISVSTTPIQIGGRRVVYAAFEDITVKKAAASALVESAEHFRVLFENAPFCGLLMDPVDLSVLDCNQRTLALLGYSREEFLNFTLYDFDVTVGKARARSVGPSGAPNSPLEFETKHRHKDGHILDIFASTSPIQVHGRTVIYAAFEDITERHELTARLRELAAHLETAREEERKHIAREIHDQLGQQLTSLKMQISACVRKHPVPEIRAEQDQIQEQLEATIRSVRSIATELRPGVLDSLGLIPALEWLAHDFEEKHGVPCTLRATECYCYDDAATTLFRIAQEALTNVARHAGASAVSITLECSPECARLEISDNGIGVSLADLAKPGHFGILGMRERAALAGGSFSVELGSPSGTRLVVNLPVKQSLVEVADAPTAGR